MMSSVPMYHLPSLVMVRDLGSFSISRRFFPRSFAAANVSQGRGADMAGLRFIFRPGL